MVDSQPTHGQDQQIDETAIKFVKCALELQAEVEKAAKGLKGLKLLASSLNHKKQDSKPQGLITQYQAYFWNLVSWEQALPSDILELMKTVSEANQSLAPYLKQQLIDDKGVPQLTAISEFIEQLERHIYDYLAKLERAPALYRAYHHLPQSKQILLKNHANDLGLTLDSQLGGGILIHLVQHIPRVPLLLTSLSEYASKTNCSTIHFAKERLETMIAGTNELNSVVNSQTPRL